MPSTLSEIVMASIGRDDLAERLTAFFAEADTAIADFGPVCRNRGDCCRFAKFGHKLYVTSIELAYFSRYALGSWRRPGVAEDCPYQIDGRCTARAFRPLGCRIFFCDPDSKDWQGPEYERRLILLRQIGADLGIDYRYVEWLSALRELTQTFRSKTAGFAGIDGYPRGMIE